MYCQEIKIPRERIAILIGKEGEIKRQIEKRANVRLVIDSKQGDVSITASDNLLAYETKRIIQAIGRGFSPEAAFQLFNEKNMFELIDMGDFIGKSKKKMERLKGRVIGEGGKSRKTIESLTGTHMVIYGKTIGIIGEIARVNLARRAVEMLLTGAPHSAAYKMLENKRRDLYRMEHMA